MSVSFAPGDHPTSASRTASSASTPSRINTFTANTDAPPSSMTNTPLTASLLTTNFPRRYPASPEQDDPERQPLIAVQRIDRGRTRLAMGIMGLMVVGLVLMIGVGGWMLSRGAGEGKWPSGPS